MKKILSLVLAAVMLASAAFALTSCGGAADDTLVCGVTIFENMNEKDENGNWTGFESEFAMEVGKIIGMNVEFQEIDWSQKYMAQLAKIPYMLVMGDKEVENGEVAIRKRGEGDIGTMKIEDFVKLIKEDIDTRVIW